MINPLQVFINSIDELLKKKEESYDNEIEVIDKDKNRIKVIRDKCQVIIQPYRAAHSVKVSITILPSGSDIQNFE